MKNRTFNAKFKAKVVIEAIIKHKELDQLSQEYGISPAVIESWSRSFVEQSFSRDTKKNAGTCLFPFMESIINSLRDTGKAGTAGTYMTTLRSFRRFRDGKDIPLEDMDSELMRAYESYLMNQGVNPNSSSFYMRILRATYNRAVEQGLTEQRLPFRHVYTGVEKTVKRALPLAKIKQIKELDLSRAPRLEFARDMFLFSFYTRGMSFVDMAYLKKKDLKGNILTYRRKKTGQLLTIRWEKKMQTILDRYRSGTRYLLPLICSEGTEAEERRQYIYAAHNINKHLKTIGAMLGLSVPLTMYVSRHSWASIAKSKNIPVSVISQGMGHDSEKTTLIYLAALDNFEIDKANRLIMNSL